MASELAEVEAELDSKFKKDEGEPAGEKGSPRAAKKTRGGRGAAPASVVSKIRQFDTVVIEAFMMTFVA